VRQTLTSVTTPRSPGLKATEGWRHWFLRNNTSGAIETVPASALFVLVGAEPHTGWLPAEIQRDDHGFVLTGSDLTSTGSGSAWPLNRAPYPLETSMPGVFAAGDVRQRSVKRVAAAVGEGSMAATQVTQYLSEPADG